jgi:hypothetical protein
VLTSFNMRGLRWSYENTEYGWSVKLNGEHVHSAKTEFDRDIFIVAATDKIMEARNEAA